MVHWFTLKYFSLCLVSHNNPNIILHHLDIDLFGHIYPFWNMCVHFCASFWQYFPYWRYLKIFIYSICFMCITNSIALIGLVIFHNFAIFRLFDVYKYMYILLLATCTMIGQLSLFSYIYPVNIYLALFSHMYSYVSLFRYSYHYLAKFNQVSHIYPYFLFVLNVPLLRHIYPHLSFWVY